MSITFHSADEATEYMRAKDAYVRACMKLSKFELATLRQARGSLNPISDLLQWGKDQLVSDEVSAKYPADILNLAIHTRSHTELPWPDCQHCQAEKPEQLAARAARDAQWTTR